MYTGFKGYAKPLQYWLPIERNKELVIKTLQELGFIVGVNEFSPEFFKSYKNPSEQYKEVSKIYHCELVIGGFEVEPNEFVD